MLTSVFVEHFKLGIAHIININGLDHVLFIIVMIAVYTYRNTARILGIITSFTVAHSLTLLLSMLKVLVLPAPWIEAIIALTIVFTCIENLFLQQLHEYRVILSGLFGLVHGMGFSNSFQEIYDTEFSLTQHLLPFNLGIEFGQILVVAVVLLVQWIGIHSIKLTTKQWNRTLSLMVLCVSAYWFILRCTKL